MNIPNNWLQLLLASHQAGVRGVAPVPVPGGMPFPYNQHSVPGEKLVPHNQHSVHPLLQQVVQHLLAPRPFGFDAQSMAEHKMFGYSQKAV